MTDVFIADYRVRKGPAHIAASRKRVNDKLDCTRKYACEPCGTVFHDLSSLNTHKKTPKHIRKINGVEKVLKRPTNNATQLAHVAAKTHYCATCDFAFRDRAAPKKHNATPRHVRKVAAAAPGSA